MTDQTAVGFGQRVTGGGETPVVFEVDKGDVNGNGSLSDAVARANAKSANGKKTKIVIKAGVMVQPRGTEHLVTAKDLTIIGESGSLILSNLFKFDCRTADNIILRDLNFRSASSSSEQAPTDSIEIDGTRKRGPIGFWIDHCRFEAYYDLNVTSNTKDADGQPPLLITVSNCRFFNAHPDGTDHRNNGALGIHGFADDDHPNDHDRARNAYATVCRNVFDHVRRRSPRSSEKTVVHAFNNVLLEWGATDTTDQVNGMDAGNRGFLIAEANYFYAGPLAEAISVGTDDAPGNLTVHQDDAVLKNVYENGATIAQPSRKQIDINAIYTEMTLTVPVVVAMDDALKAEIEAGVPLAPNITKIPAPAP